MIKALADLNDHMEREEKERKDARKIGQTKAGRVNHIRQKHGKMARVVEICHFCKGKFHRQGLSMHTRFCWVKPNKDGAI